MRAEVGAADPFAHAASQLAFANIAPAEEKAPRFAALGDRYVELGDRATAREMYREALQHKPGDHLMLTKYLGMVTDEGDWAYSLDVIQRLVDTEKDKRVRARYKHLGAMIARDEIDDHEQAIALYQDALHDDPLGFAVADELESLLASSPDADALIRFYYQRLEDVRAEEGRPKERLRLWDQLGELCLQLGRNDDAVTAFEVALTLAPEQHDRKQRLADMYFGDQKYDGKAIAQNHAVLKGDHRRMESYKALRSLYERAKQPEKARAIDDAVEVIGTLDQRIEGLFSRKETAPPAERTKPRQPLTNDDFVVLARIDVDLALTALFALVAPPFGVDRARMRPPASVPTKEQDPPVAIATVLGRVVGALGVKRPPVYLDKEQKEAGKLSMRARDGVLTPVLTIGRAALDKQLDENELAFHLARQLADLRGERIARLLCPRAGELAQIIELAEAKPDDAGSHASRWLQTALHPVELAQAQAIGARLRERDVQPMSAAVEWLASTERAADRIALVVVGDLAACARQLDEDRRLALAWASTTDELLSVRARVEGWSAVGPFSRRVSN
jgi:tetratricopeptide (TPR) repeat protein